MTAAAQLPFMIQLLDDESPTVRAEVLKGLASFGPGLRREINQLDPAISSVQLKQLYSLLFAHLHTHQQLGDYALFYPGQVIKHLRYGYRGVIASHDLYCQAEDKWYLNNRTQPDRNQPWYHILVDGTNQVTYAAEECLSTAPDVYRIKHPFLEYFFNGYEQGAYQRNSRPWPREN